MTLGEIKLIHIGLGLLILAALWCAQYLLQLFLIYRLDPEFLSEMVGEVKQALKEFYVGVFRPRRRK